MDIFDKLLAAVLQASESPQEPSPVTFRSVLELPDDRIVNSVSSRLVSRLGLALRLDDSPAGSRAPLPPWSTVFMVTVVIPAPLLLWLVDEEASMFWPSPPFDFDGFKRQSTGSFCFHKAH